MFVGIYIVFGALSGLQLTNGAANKKNEDYSPIIYPGPVQDVSNRYGTKNVTDKCRDLTYCTVKPDDYPQELFNRMFKGKYKEPIFQPTLVMTDDRQGDPDEIDNCEPIVTYEPLYKVKSKEGEWHTVVQAPKENYIQLVRLETCKVVGAPCFTDFTSPEELETFCKQKYTVWEFLVHDGKNGTKKVKADLPICCSCHFKNKYI